VSSPKWNKPTPAKKDNLTIQYFENGPTKPEETWAGEMASAELPLAGGGGGWGGGEGGEMPSGNIRENGSSF
jgi:hypothetical protein